MRPPSIAPTGGEVSLNFLGSLLTSPLEVRRAELRSQYGFTCGCSRCAAEARHAGTPLAALLERTYAACRELAPELDAAIAAGDSAAVADAKERLVRMQVRAHVRVCVCARVRQGLQLHMRLARMQLASQQLLFRSDIFMARAPGGPGGGHAERGAQGERQGPALDAGEGVRGGRSQAPHATKQPP